MEHCCSQRGSTSSCCDITAESRVGDICRRRYRFVIVCFREYDGIARCVSVVMGVKGAVACAGLNEAGVEPLLLIADAFVQAVMEVCNCLFEE
jgi:hypothetical protein